MRDFGVFDEDISYKTHAFRMRMNPTNDRPVGIFKYAGVISHVFKVDGRYVFADTVPEEDSYTSTWNWCYVPEENLKPKYKWIKFGGV